MPIQQPKFLRMARLIHDQLLRQASKFRPLALPIAQWNCLSSVIRSIRLAHERSWHVAARQRSVQMLREIEDLQDALRCLAEQLRDIVAPKPIPNLADLYRDLVALDHDFEDVECDLDQQLISVTTGPIVLQDIELGRFQIRLHWKGLSGTHSYRAVALDANPAVSNENVTHPHVSDEILCEGDERVAIRAALTTGRLYDFFMIVNQLLQTYAQGRAYVDLDQWYGQPCCDCGNTVSDDDRYSCNHCEETICSDCACFCSQCDQVYCSGCSTACQQCDRTICQSCLERCRLCGSRACSDCLTQNLCSQCHDTQSDNNEPEEECPEEAAPSSTMYEPAVQPHGMGEASVSA